MSEFFYPDGKPIENQNDFIRYYSDCYYLGSEKPIPGLSQSSRYTEGEIERLLREGIQEKVDIAHILAWKIGKIKHRDSEASGSFVYAKDWENAEKLENIYRYNRSFELNTIAEYIVGNISSLEELAIKDPQRLLNKLCNLNISGIGTVYLITLLYFISKSKWPIYDRFAAMSLSAILNGKKPGEIVEYRELPEKGTKGFETIFCENSAYRKYIAQMESIFMGKDLTCRDIDRALWVYGHLFKVK